MSIVSTDTGNPVATNPQIVAEEPARMAQEAHRKHESFAARFAKLGRQQLEAAIEAGHHLQKAKEIVGHGNFKKEQERWLSCKIVSFSLRSGRRYMSLATHADALKMANVANLRDAEQYIAGLKSHKETLGHANAGVSSPLDKQSADLVAQAETRVINDMRRLERDEQRSFLEGLIARLNNRLENLET